jgi:uncharacterized protein YxjI
MEPCHPSVKLFTFKLFSVMQYPLQLTFKFFALAPQIAITDASGQSVMFVRQKLFKLKEVINVFADAERTQPLYDIKADRILDFSARYNFTNPNGESLGSVKRKGMKSFWKAHYDVMEGDRVVYSVQEENPWIKILDSLFSEVPILGMFTGYVFNPVYLVSDASGRVVMRLEKTPSFLSRIFTIKQMDKLDEQEQGQILLSLMMLLLLERNRG